MTLRASSPIPLPNALPKPVLRRSTHVWNGLDLLSSPASGLRSTEPDITDADYAHTEEMMKMLDEEIERTSTELEQATEPPQQSLILPVPLSVRTRVPFQRLTPVEYNGRTN